ncbi:viral A-type inclusion protein, partial [Reticulomyxa filosa]
AEQEKTKYKEEIDKLKTMNQRLSENCKTVSQALEQEIAIKQRLQVELSKAEHELKTREKPADNTQVHYTVVLKKKKKKKGKIITSLLTRFKVKGDSIKDLDDYMMKCKRMSEEMGEMAQEKEQLEKECVDLKRKACVLEQQVMEIMNGSDNKSNIEMSVLKSENERLQKEIRTLEEKNSKFTDEMSVRYEQNLRQMEEQLNHLQANQKHIFDDYEAKLANANDEKKFLKSKYDNNLILNDNSLKKERKQWTQQRQSQSQSQRNQ